ncbi:esterase-like activity of phytase family protein [Undibacterium sp. FT79W]|uniref:esterase-like activity of phytase family protein n=1 Tax=Undibacterium sp. FT79W TaxID=2762296 RepID=UPI00164A8F3B|nr:esterase-like activity of phytase family protein [Undibacterium sp. FT79W]MBC3877999.1 esterase-like activity of phytase family protein [Undibacterium sp. FT79W]
MNHNKNVSLLAALTASALVAACGGSDTTSTATPAPVAQSGVFLDAAVEGLDYTSGTAKGTTQVDGGFSCNSGDSMSFSVGGISLGSAPCAAVITPLSLANLSNSNDDKVVNRLMALQLLDEDNDPSNGIRLSSTVKTALAGQALDFNANAATFNTAMTNLLSKLPAAYQSRSADADRRALVREHFEDTLASKMDKPVVDAVTQTNALGTVVANVTRYQIKAADAFYVPYEGTNAAVKADFPKGFLPSYGSGLTFKGKAADGSLEFYGITDRGPNGDGPKVPNSVVTAGATGTSDAKFFPSPSFTPSIGLISVGKNGATLKSSMPIKFSSTINASGLSIAAGKVGSSGEVPLNDAMKYDAASKTTFSDYGLDTESVVLDTARGVFWVSDEYGPFILKIDMNTGIILKKYQPGTGAADLPAVLLKRRANRGMEGLSLDAATGKLQGFIQSPLDDGKASYKVPGATVATNESIKDYAKFNRWVEFDPTTEKTKLYAYPLDSTMYASGKTGGAKLGDLVALGGGKFIVIEQGASVDGKVFNRLMLVQIPSDATDIAAMGTDLEKSSMTGAAVNGVNYANVVTLKKTVLFDLNGAGWLAEKAEGLALVDEYTLALVNDDDFGLKTLITDANGKTVEGADITKCTVDANGALTTTAGATGCVAGNSVRVARGADSERPNRLWLFKFNKKLADFAMPAQ